MRVKVLEGFTITGRGYFVSNYELLEGNLVETTIVSSETEVDLWQVRLMSFDWPPGMKAMPMLVSLGAWRKPMPGEVFADVSPDYAGVDSA